jgi:hypothetical protein
VEFAITDVVGEGERFPWRTCIRELKVIKEEWDVGQEGEEMLAL